MSSSGNGDVVVEPAPPRGPDRRRSRLDGGPEMTELVIESRPGWRAVNFGELYRYRDLFYYLTLRGSRRGTAQSALGVGWAVIQPVATTVVFTVIFGRLAKIDSDGLPYALFAFCGMVPWTFFANALNEGVTSLVKNTEMISKVYFPRLVLPLSAIAAKLVDLTIASVLLAGMMAAYGVVPGPGVVVLPLLFAIMLLSGVGLSLWLGALAVQYRDVAYGLNFAVQILMYLTPVVYPASLIPDKFRWIYGLNPMAGVIEGLRGASGQPGDALGPDRRRQRDRRGPGRHRHDVLPTHGAPLRRRGVISGPFRGRTIPFQQSNHAMPVSNVLAIIPARGGSKGIPRKNVRPVGGLPLLGWTIEAAPRLGRVNRVVVSTDDPEIAEVSQRFGAEVVWRPSAISGDSGLQRGGPAARPGPPPRHRGVRARTGRVPPVHLSPDGARGHRRHDRGPRTRGGRHGAGRRPVPLLPLASR